MSEVIERRFCWDQGWRFARGDPSGAEAPTFDDAGWRALDLPHDWSIEGPFSQDHPSGGGGGSLPGGVGWYRKRFRLPDVVSRADTAGKRTWIELDGVYKNCDVWINGQHLGFHPYGYTSFHYDLTPYLRNDGGENVLAVRVDDSQQPEADDPVTFEVSGPGRLIGADNGDPHSHEPFQSSKRHAFYGLCLAIVQSTGRPGPIEVTASAPGMPVATAQIDAVKTKGER